MGGSGVTGGITGDSGDLPGGSAKAKYIKIDVPDFNNALAYTTATGTPAVGSGQGPMRTYLRLGAVEGSPVTPGKGPPSPYKEGGAPNAADLGDLVQAVQGNPMLWSTIPADYGAYNIGAVNAAETNNADQYYINTTTGLFEGVQGDPTANAVPGIIFGQFLEAAFGLPITSPQTMQAGNTASWTVGLVIPGQLTATMINAGVTGTTGDPYLAELVPSTYDSTGEDLASLVKGFLDDSRMRSDAGVQNWLGGEVAIGTPFDSNYCVTVGSNVNEVETINILGISLKIPVSGFVGSFPQGMQAPDDYSVDLELAAIKPAPFMMPTWGPSPPPPPAGDPWKTGPGASASIIGMPDWSVGGFPASTDLPPGVTPKFWVDGDGKSPPPPPSPPVQGWVPGWMVPIRLGGPQASMWGAQATPNTSAAEGPLLGWDPHPSANANTPDWTGAIIHGVDAIYTTLPAFGLDDDGNKVGAGVPLDPRDQWGMTPLPGYGQIYPQLDKHGELVTPNAPNINAVSDWLATDYRTIESNQIHIKGGWRDHTDGNRITTTRGDKVEVIRGNYKLIVIGRQDQSKGAGFDMGGGGNDGTTTGSASTDPSTLSSITEYKLCDDGQYRSWSTSKKGSGTPKLSGDGITVTLPTGSVQVSESWGWKSYNYTGVEKLKVLSGGGGPAAGGAKWFGPVQLIPGKPPADPKSYKPVAYDYNDAALGPNSVGFASGPSKPIAGGDIFVKGGMNDDTRGIIWPVAESISESHTTKTYSATFVRDTVSITAGPMLTVPFSLSNTTGAGEILDWPSGKTFGGFDVSAKPFQLPPTQGAIPSVDGKTGAVTYNPSAGPSIPAPLVLDAFGAYPLAKITTPGAPGFGGGLSSDYAPGKGLEGTGIPIPGQPYQKVNSTTSEQHVKTSISRNFTDVSFSQSFVGKSFSQTGTKAQPNKLTNSISFVDTSVSESHVYNTTSYSHTGQSTSRTYIGADQTGSNTSVGGAVAEGLGAILVIPDIIEGLTVPVKDDYTHTVGVTQSRSETYGATNSYTMLIGGSNSMGLTVGVTSDIKILIGGSSSITITAGATSSISILAGVSSKISLNISIDFSLTLALSKYDISIPGASHTKNTITGVWTDAKVTAAATTANLLAAYNTVTAGTETKITGGIETVISAMAAKIHALESHM